jgi:hypothetical protein
MHQHPLVGNQGFTNFPEGVVLEKIFLPPASNYFDRS